MRSELLPVERLLFRSPLVQVGRFDCPADNALFRDSGPIVNDVVVFPRTTVRIRHDGKPAFVSDATRLNFYNSGQKYTREAVDGRDRCDWIAMDREFAEELTREVRPFPWAFGPLPPELFLEERRLVQALESGSYDVLEIEERCVAIVACAAAAAAKVWSGGQARPEAVTARHFDIVEKAKELLRREQVSSLRAAAAATGVSPFQLSRTFRRVTGLTLTAYRKQLQLRRAADEVLSSDVDLSQIALDNSFSSHSHLTKDFRRAFGLTPSALRKNRN